MSATMREVCAIFDVNVVAYCGNFYIHELGVTGMGVWDEPYSCVYDMKSCPVSPFSNSVDVYGLTVAEDGSDWRDVYKNLLDHWDYYKSKDKRKVAVIGNPKFLEILTKLGIECVDLLDIVNEDCHYDAAKNAYLKFSCGLHYTPSEKGCAAARVAYYKNWLIKKI